MPRRELKPCPFCGAAADAVHEGMHRLVRCPGCGCRTDLFWSAEDAAARWNRRAPVTGAYAVLAEPFEGDELHHEMRGEVLGVYPDRESAEHDIETETLGALDVPLAYEVQRVAVRGL